MTESAALLADEVLPRKPLRQWVLSLPYALRFLLATNPRALTLVLGFVLAADRAGQRGTGEALADRGGDLRDIGLGSRRIAQW